MRLRLPIARQGSRPSQLALLRLSLLAGAFFFAKAFLVGALPLIFALWRSASIRSTTLRSWAGFFFGGARPSIFAFTSSTRAAS